MIVKVIIALINTNESYSLAFCSYMFRSSSMGCVIFAKEKISHVPFYKRRIFYWI